MRITTFLTGCLLLFSISLSTGCTENYSQANDAAVEKLRQQLIAGRYGEIYRDSSEITKAQLTSDEFTNKMSTLHLFLSEIDEDIKWRRDERGSPEKAVYSEDNWSSLILEKNGRSMNIQLSWNDPFKLCGIEVSGDVPDGGMRLFRNCD
jgi:hypothetical protein